MLVESEWGVVIVRIENVSFSYGAREIIEDVNLTLTRKMISVIMGPSGCGKTTLLRIVAGLLLPAGGALVWQSGSDDSTSRLRFMFQDFDAFPWFNVWDNVKLGSGRPPHPSDEAVCELLNSTGLYEFRNLFPNELSGGLRKRLALSRAVIRRPSLLILDEPFGSLDVATKSKMYELLSRVVQETECGVVMVSHDPHEAITLADEIHISSGRPMSIVTSISNKLEKPRRPESPAYAAAIVTLLTSLQQIKTGG